MAFFLYTYSPYVLKDNTLEQHMLDDKSYIINFI